MVTERHTRKRTLWDVLIDVLGTPTAESIAPPAVTGSWQWLYADKNGVAAPGSPARFPSAEAAERWLDSNSGPLEGLGVAAVSLLDGEHVVYGPVRLSPGSSAR